MSEGYWLLSTIYERNLFYQQINFRWLSLRYLLRVLQDSGKVRKTVYTSVFLFVYLMDFVIGISVLYYVLYMNPGLGVLLRTSVSSYTIAMLDWTEQLITWMMGIPAGLKLNTPLNEFLGTKFLTILSLWKYFYFEFIASFLTWIVWFIIYLSAFGISLSLTLLHDFLKFLNLSLICFFIISTRAFLLQISALKSLARLFMGKKWNVLKNRVDSCDYDTNQLLMGTVLFTILLFLLPTTGMYFVIFLLLKAVQFVLQLLLRMATVTLNKTTVVLWDKLVAHLSDDPVAEMRILIEYSSDPNTVIGCSHVDKTRDTASTESGENYSKMPCNAKVTVKWNARSYCVDDVKEFLSDSSTHNVLQESNTSPGNVLKHTMLRFIPKLKP